MIILVAYYFYSLEHICDLQNLPLQTLVFNAISDSWFCSVHWDFVDLKERILFIFYFFIFLKVRILEGVFCTVINYSTNSY